MKKVFLAFFAYSLLVPCQTYSASLEEIKKFFKYDQGNFLDYYWLRPREIYDEWTNHSRFTTSYLTVTYAKRSNDSFLDGFKEYLNDQPLSWKHQLNYRTILYQNNRRDFHPVIEAYDVREGSLGQLEIVHKHYNFAIGTFDKDGRYDYREYDVRMVDLELWRNIFYDPWHQRMYYLGVIPNENDRKTYTDTHVNADQFLFRFKDDSQVRSGKIEVVTVSGFSQPVALLDYQGRLKPISKNADIKMNWDRDRPTVSFDVHYYYDERELFITPEGIVQFSKTLEEFMTP